MDGWVGASKVVVGSHHKVPSRGRELRGECPSQLAYGARFRLSVRDSKRIEGGRNGLAL